MLPAEIDKLLAVLDERERYILTLRFGLDRGEPRTPDEVGQLVNLSRERVRQIEARALARLRHPSVEMGAGLPLVRRRWRPPRCSKTNDQRRATAPHVLVRPAALAGGPGAQRPDGS